MNFLIIKLAAIGDVIMALPMINAIRRLYPQARITWAAGNGAAALLDDIEGIDRVVAVDERAFFLGNALQRLKVLLHFRRQCADVYDVVAVGNHHFAYKLLGKMVRHRKMVSFGRWNNLPLPGRYHGVEYVRLIDPLFNGPRKQWPCFPKLKPQALAEGPQLPTDKTLVALAPGGARNILADDWQRRWPLSKFKELARNIIESGGRPILLGGPDERHLSEQFVGMDLLDFIGKTSLREILRLLRQCGFLAANDSGIMHLGRLLPNLNVIGLFGPTNPAEKLPVGEKAFPISSYPPLPCMPCYNGRIYLPCENNKCMDNITVKQVMAFIKISPEDI